MLKPAEPWTLKAAPAEGDTREAPLLVMETFLIEELEAARRALEYYADPTVYRRYGPEAVPVHPILAEGGRLAREALGLPRLDPVRCLPVDEGEEPWSVLILAGAGGAVK